MTELSRPVQFSNKVLIVDGLSGTGKAAVYPILQGLKRVENVIIDYAFEYICESHYLKGMSANSAENLLRILTDFKLYEVMSSRAVNFRPSDVTSAMNTHLRSVYLDRLFQPDGLAAVDRIEKEQPILHLMTHQMFAVSKPMFQALGDRLLFVEVVRNPLYMLRHWHGYMHRYGRDVRDFSLWIDYKGKSLPWFAVGNEDLYLESNTMDKIIHSIKWFSDMRKANRDSLTDEEKERHVQVRFTYFVKNPYRYIKRIAGLLQTDTNPHLDAIMKQQNIPRDLPNEGVKGGGIWTKLYGEIAPDPNSTEDEEIQKCWDYAAAEASPQGMEVLEKLVYDFEKFANEHLREWSL